MKPSKYYLPLLAAVLLPGGGLHATDKDAFFYFDEEGVNVALDSSGNNLNMEYSSPEAFEVSYENPKFGGSSLKVTGPKGGIKQSLKEDPYTKLGEEIQRMSVVAWIYLPEQIKDDIGFSFLVRQSISSKKRNGDWRLAVHSALGLRFATLSESLAASPRHKELYPGSWTHYAMIFEEGMISLYENGMCIVQKPSEPLSIPEADQTDGAQPRFVGLSGLPEGSFVDDLGYFGDTALSEEDIHKIMKTGLQDFVENRETP